MLIGLLFVVVVGCVESFDLWIRKILGMVCYEAIPEYMWVFCF